MAAPDYPLVPGATEVDLLLFDVYLRPGFKLDAVEAQIRAICLPHLKHWGDEFIASADEPEQGINKIRALAVTDGKIDVAAVEIAIQNVMVGNHSAVSSTAFVAYTKA